MPTLRSGFFIKEKSSPEGERRGMEIIPISSKNCKSSNSMWPKVQGDRKALVAPAGAKFPC